MGTSNNLLLSVLMTCYNAEQYIQKAVESILCQTYCHFELIIVDDGSIDHSWDILQKFQDPRIRLIRNEENIGQTRSLNKAISLANGEFIARHDADDYSHKDRFQIQVDFLIKHPEVGLLGTSYYYIDNQDQILDSIYPPRTNVELQSRLLDGNIFCHGSVMIRTELLRIVGGYNENFRVTQDYDLWLRLAERCEIANLQQPLYYFRFDSESITRKNRPLQLAYRRLARELAEQRRQSEIEAIPENILVAYPPEPDRIARDARWVSYLYYAADNTDLASTYLQQSVDSLSDDLTEKDWADWAISKAHIINNLKGDIRAGGDFIKWFSNVFDNKKKGFSVRNLLGRYYADCVFLSDNEVGVFTLSRLFLLAVYNDPKWVLNRGLWSILMQGFRRIPWIVFAVLGVSLLGFISVIIITQYGIGLSPDSVYYIDGARNLALNRGFINTVHDPLGVPVTHHLPYYPFILSLIARIGWDPLIGARWLGATLFTGNILLSSVGLIFSLKQSKNPNLWLSIYAGLFMLLSATMLEIHTMAWTEPLFITLSLLGFLLLARYHDSQSLFHLSVSALVVGLAFLTRYAGIALLAAGSLSILLFVKNRPFAVKFLHAIIFGIVGALPAALWMVRNYLLAGTAVDRSITFQSFDKTHLWELVTTLTSWFLIPQSLGTVVKVVLIGVIFILLAVLYWIVIIKMRARHSNQARPGQISKLIQLLILFAPIYIITLAATNIFLDTYTPFDYRILSPIYVVGLIVIFYLFGELANTFSNHRWISVTIFLALLIILGFYGNQVVRYASQAYQSGLGFNQLIWKNSATLDAVRKLESSTPIYSNFDEAIYIHVTVPANPIPKQTRTYVQSENSEYVREFLEMEDALLNNGGVLVYFNFSRDANLPVEEIVDELNLVLLRATNDGAMYTASSNP